MTKDKIFESDNDNNINKSQDNVSTKQLKSKSNAKALGLKSTLAFDNKLVLTSFVDNLNVEDDNNIKCTNIEKLTDYKGNVTNVSKGVENPYLFNAEVNEKEIRLSSRIHNDNIINNNLPREITINNPVSHNLGDDYIGIKSEIEKKFFDSSFDKDNLHIQIAYNILDIKKIINAYVNNVVQMFYNLSRNVDNSIKVEMDIIGMIKYAYPLKEDNTQNTATNIGTHEPKYINNNIDAINLIKNTSAYFMYFDDVFINLNDKDSKKDTTKYKKAIEENYNVIRVLGFIRNSCMHGTLYNNLTEDMYLDIYNNLSVEDSGSKEPTDKKSLLHKLDSIYNKGIKTINDTFFDMGNSSSNNKKDKDEDKKGGPSNNLYILSQIFKTWSIEDLIKEYYLYSIVKEQKNIGINIKHLRECIIKEGFEDLQDKKYDTCRSKLYTILDFVLFETILNNKVDLTRMQNRLRSNQYGKEGKDLIYLEFARIFRHKVNYRQVIDIFNKEKDNRFKNKLVMPYTTIPDYAITADNTDYFVKMVYFLSKFLDGKEINELYSSLINKFDNIGSLLYTAKMCQTNVKFAPKYKIFDNCELISEQLRITKSISRMKRNLNQYNEQVIKDACDVLNVQGYKNYNDILQAVKTSKDKGNKNTKFRNFLLTNVIHNRRFFYIIKYTDPKIGAMLAQNRNLVSLALHEMQESQIQRYFFSLTGKQNHYDYNTAKNIIINMICNFKIDDVKSTIDNLTSQENKTRDGNKKGQMSSIITLYLTVIYLIVKNIIKVNTSFAIAFSALERDYYFLKPRIDEMNRNNNNKVNLSMNIVDENSNYLCLTKLFLYEDDLVSEEIAKLSQMYNKNNPVEVVESLRAKKKELVKKLHFKFKRKPSLKAQGMLEETKVIKLKDNLKEAEKNKKAYIQFRNIVAHLNVIKGIEKYLKEVKGCSSYYAFYCFILQNQVLHRVENSDFYTKYYNKLDKYGYYQKDLMKYLCMPFAYNLARFKNLSIENLYNKVFKDE